MDQVKEAQMAANTIIPQTEKEFWEWCQNSKFTAAQDRQAMIVRLSFQTLRLNKYGSAAFAQAQRMHDADMAKLEAMLNS